MNKNQRKGVMSEIIGIFILVLVISALAGMTFLFTSQLKTQVSTQAKTSDTITVINETYTLRNSSYGGNPVSVSSLRSCILTSVVISNSTSGAVVPATNYTINSPSNCYITADVNSNYNLATVNVSYSYTYLPYTDSENAVNGTEAAGANIVNYLPLLFLAIIFGAILAVVLKIILPYINLGNSISGF